MFARCDRVLRDSCTDEQVGAALRTRAASIHRTHPDRHCSRRLGVQSSAVAAAGPFSFTVLAASDSSPAPRIIPLEVNSPLSNPFEKEAGQLEIPGVRDMTLTSRVVS